MKQETRKKLSKILKILAIIVLMVSLIIIMSEDKPTFADSGFSASYDGGSSSSSSYSSSYDGSSDEVSEIGCIIFILIMIITYVINSNDKKVAILKVLKYLIITVLIFILIIYLTLKINGATVAMLIWLIVIPCIVITTTKSILGEINKNKQVLNEKLNKYIPNFNKEEFLQTAFEIYKDVQIAWMNFDLESVKDKITDEMYNMYEAQLTTLEVKGEKNMMENMKLKSSRIIDITSENGIVTITTVSEIIQKDYIIEVATGKVLRGNKNIPMHMKYRMKYRMSIDENAKLENCPNCGAKLENMNGVATCEYCNSKVVAENTKWVLTEKVVLMQR